MPQPKIDVFSEGATEKNVMAQLAKRGVIAGEFEERGGGGEQTMMTNLRLRLREWSELPDEQRQPVKILVLRDWDKHEGKRPEGKLIEDICKSTVDVLRPFDQTAELLPHQTHGNVFALKATLTGLQLVLHIADQPYLPAFVKATIDDYVLKLALMESTAEALLQNKREAGARQKPKRKWGIDAPALQKKLLEEIPQLLSQNKIPAMLEAKEYVRIYSTLLQLHASPPVFAEKVLAHAVENDVREVFASLLAAVQLLTLEN